MLLEQHLSEEVLVFPASFAQQRLWFLQQLAPDNPFYNVPAAIHLQGKLNLSALEQAFNEIERRHEILRTTFAMVEEELVQIIYPHHLKALSIVDLQDLPAIARLQEADKTITETAQQSFDLATGPLFRVQVLCLEESDHILSLNLHHIVADGWSIAVLVREISLLYSAFVAGKPTPLPELTIQYADFAHWQKSYLQGEVLNTQLTYWQQQLQDLPTVQLPTDFSRPSTSSYRGASQQLELSPELTIALEDLSDRAGVSLFMTLLAAFQTQLYRYTGQTDIVVSSPIANRNRTELENLIGFFVNSLVLRTDLSANPTFEQLLERVRRITLAAYAHQDIPFEKLVETLQPLRDLSRNPLFQVVFTLQNTPIESLNLPGLTLSPFPITSTTARVDLELHCYKDQDRLRCTAIYSTDLFRSDTIFRLLEHFQTILESIIANPSQPIAYLPLLSNKERHQLLVEWNQTQIDNFCGTAAHHLFEAQVEKTPDAIAIAFQSQSLTYKELNQQANQLAHYLQKLGIGPDVLVGLCLNRSPAMVISLLAIWKAGGAYLPLDLNYPRDRLQFMLADAGVSILVTHQPHLHLFESHALQIICLDQNREAIAQQSQLNTKSPVTCHHLAYLIYTSGSTGQPKGVLVEHQGLSNVVAVQKELFAIAPHSRILQFASLSFDASLFEILMALTQGATLYLAPQNNLLPGQDLFQFLRDSAITHATLPPSVLATLPTEPLPALRILIAAGEACSRAVVQRWAEGRRFFNAYGPTEVTIWATVAELASDINPDRPVSIGRAIANTQTYILDAHLQPVPIGQIGELYIAGVGLAKGYLNQPDINAEKFISNPFQTGSYNRLYKTGDLARYQPDGTIEYIGRSDNQVKLHGFRIELGEIEAALQQHPFVQTAVVIMREDLASQRLVAYVVPDPPGKVTSGELQNFLRSRLPQYLIPRIWVVLESLPLTPNGKIDRAALPAPQQSDGDRNQACISPRTSTEAKLAQLWAEVLHLEQINIDDNFFALGGDSFLALQLMEKVERQFEQALPLSTLFLTPTVEQLAQKLDTEATSQPWSPLVPLQASGSHAPFFCIHPMLGVVLPYYELSRQLGVDYPFYGLQPFGLDGKQAPLTTIEAIAAYYIEAIQAIQPRGPYHLGGWSFGGLVAFEMAQQLKQAGHEVALLALLDTLAPIPANQPSLWGSLRFLLTTLARSISPFILDYWHLLLQSLIQSLSESHSKLQFPLPTPLIAKLKALTTSRTPLASDLQLRVMKELAISPMLRIFLANSQAVHRYVPQRYPGKITLFRAVESADESTHKHKQHESLGWNQLTTEAVKVYEIPGNHFSILKQPHVQALAAQLKCCFVSDSLS